MNAKEKQSIEDTMNTTLTVVEPKYREYDTDILQEDMDHLIKANESLESEVKKLRKDKSHLIEQMTLIKTFSDGLWDRLKANHWL